MDVILSTHDLCFLDKLCYPNFALLRGQTTFLCGESGSGKSSLFRLCNATLSPSSGTIFYEGRDIATLDTLALRKEVLLVSQTVFLLPGTITENVGFYFSARGEAAPTAATMQRFLRLCCAEFPLDTVCETLSGGERQRVFLAIHLALLPKVLLLDEPTSALDGETARRVLSGIQSSCREQGQTLFIISHDNALVDQYAEQRIQLEGRVSQ